MNTALKLIAIVIAIPAVVRTVTILTTVNSSEKEYILGVIVGNTALLIVAVVLYRYAHKRSAVD